MDQQVKAAVFFAAALLLCVGGSAAQELDSQIHIVPALQQQAKATPPQNQTNDVQSVSPQSASPQAGSSQGFDAQTEPQTPGPGKSEITIPPGTRVSMVLAQAISIDHARPGDILNLQTSFPVAVDNQMAIPPGTYVKAVIDKVMRKDKGRAVMAMRLRSIDIVFANGYTVAIPAPVNIDPVLARYTAPDSSRGQPGPVLAGAGGVRPPIAMGATGYPELPPLPPLHDSGIKTAMIATGIASAAAIVATGILMATHHGYGYDVRMEAGTPMEIILSAPLLLDTSRVAEAIHAYGERVSRLQATVSPNPAFP